MLDLQLDKLPLHVVVFASVLIFLLLAFIAFFVVRGLRLRHVLVRLARQIETTGEHPGDLSDYFASDGSLRRLWQEFRKTLHEQKELNAQTGEFELKAMRPTLPAEAIFNTQAVVDNRLGTEFFKHLPGIFTGVGIIGTFFGLILGLQAFQVSETASVVRQSLNSLLHGVWEAFLVSALAIALAMLVTLVEKLLLASLYKRVEKLNQAIDGQLQAGAGEEYLSRLVQASEESAAQTRILKDALVTDLRQILSEVTERQISAMQAGNTALGQTISTTIATSLQEPLAQIAKATGGMREDQSGAVQKLLTDVLAGFSQKIEDLFGSQVAGINELQQQTIQALKAAVTRLEQMATDVQTSGTKTTEAMAERLNQAVTGMEARQEALNRRMGELLDHIRQSTRESQSETRQKLEETLTVVGSTMEQMITALAAQGDRVASSRAEHQQRVADRASQVAGQLKGQVDEVLKAVTTASGEMARAVSELKSVTTDSIAKMNSGADTLYVAASDFARAGQAVSGTLKQASSVSDQFAQAAGSVAMSTRVLEGAVADHKATRDMLAKLLNELQLAVTNAKRDASMTSDVLQRIEKATAALGNAQLEAEGFLENVSAVLVKSHSSFSENMHQTLTKADRAFHEQLSTATNLLHESIGGLEEVLADLHVKA
jgi:hypothetical protein